MSAILPLVVQSWKEFPWDGRSCCPLSDGGPIEVARLWFPTRPVRPILDLHSIHLSGHLLVDHMFDILDIQSPGCDCSGHCPGKSSWLQDYIRLHVKGWLVMKFLLCGPFAWSIYYTYLYLVLLRSPSTWPLCLHSLE